jgi:hypothetical protein
MARKLTHNELLDLEFESRDLHQTLTVANYLRELLLTLWHEGEGFSGKRPFGNSGWEYDLYVPLIKAGAIPGELDVEDDFEGVYSVDDAAARELVDKLIRRLFRNAQLMPVLKRQTVELA